MEENKGEKRVYEPQKKHICIAISLVLNPASISQVSAQADTNKLTVEVDEPALAMMSVWAMTEEH